MNGNGSDAIKKYTAYFFSHYRNLCGKGRETYHDTMELPFDETWFCSPSNKYNPGLAFAGMGLSLSTYKNKPSNGFQFISKSMRAFELEDIDISTYYHRNEENHIDFENCINLIAFSIGHRKIRDAEGNQRDLVIAVVRGTCATVEWDSNADVADTVTDGNYDLPFHEGFKNTSDVAFKEMCAYLNKHDLNRKDVILWIVGHSRGATIVNLLAAAFDAGNADVVLDHASNECNGRGSTICSGFIDVESKIPKENIYAYTFSSSRTTTREDASSEAFDNIFNVINPEDYIPRIPLSAWGYKRFGKDIYMPSVATSCLAYRKIEGEYTRKFLEWTRIGFQQFNGFAKTNLFQKHAYDISKSVSEMYMNRRFSHGGTLTFAQYFRTFTDVASKSGIEVVSDAKKLTRYCGGSFEHFLSYFIVNQIINHEALCAHQEEGYLAKLKCIYEMGIDIERAGNVCDTKCFTIWGPADVDVYDEKHQIVGRIAKGKVDSSLYELPCFVAMFSDNAVDQKSFWIPQDQHYEIDIKPERDFAFDVSISVQTCEGLTVESDYYEGVELKRGSVCKWEDVKPRSPSRHIDRCNNLACEVRVQLDGPTEDLEQLEKYGVINSTSEVGASSAFGEGPTVLADAMATRNNTWGDHVVVHAYHCRHLYFTGWYEPNGVDPVSLDRSYVFKIKENRELVAHFARK